MPVYLKGQDKTQYHQYATRILEEKMREVRQEQ